MLLDLGEAPADRALVGGKAASLAELTRAGLPVPPGFVLTTAAFDHMMSNVDPEGRYRDRIARLDPDELDKMSEVTAELRERLERAPVPEQVRGFMLESPVAVRSSATGEDGTDASFAGLQETYLWVRGEEAVLRHIQRCWASLYSVESVSYRRRRGLPEEMAMAVVVQRMVDPRCAGVMFTRSPVTGDRSVVAIEATWGLGSALVGGEVTPDRLVVSKVTGEVVSRAVADKPTQHRPDPAGGVRVVEVPVELRQACCLADPEIAALVALGKRIEEHYRAPQDIEWALADQLYVLQSRPETVWARREAAAPIAQPRERALDHVLDVLGGRAAWR